MAVQAAVQRNVDYGERYSYSKSICSDKHKWQLWFLVVDNMLISTLLGNPLVPFASLNVGMFMSPLTGDQRV